MTKDKDALIEERRRLTEEIGAIEQHERQAQYEALVGRHFKYRNCYSCPEKASDYWWLYVKVINAEDGWLTIKQFQTDKLGTLIASIDKRLSWNDAGYKPITLAEYDAAWTKFRNAVNAFGEH